jgi:hypothetical protein
VYYSLGYEAEGTMTPSRQSITAVPVTASDGNIQKIFPDVGALDPGDSRR